MRYVEARFESFVRDEAYRIYVTRSLQLAPQNQYLTASYADIVQKKYADERSGDEIAMDIITRAGLSFGE